MVPCINSVCYLPLLIQRLHCLKSDSSNGIKKFRHCENKNVQPNNKKVWVGGQSGAKKVGGEGGGEYCLKRFTEEEKKCDSDVQINNG